MKIDGKEVEVKKGQTVLEVARDAGIYIPTLCTHHELPSFGSCRLCLVKIDGMRGFPTACTTPAGDDMVVTTGDEELTTLKRNILTLLLSEHPNSCILCEDKELCEKYRSCPMKAGQITGCQLCPNKEDCDLREVIEHLGIERVDYEFSYKHMDLERNDPFFDRDYNICILCGRCVRVCDEIRGMGVIAFTKRGHETRIDTAFGKSHLETGCRFCGACVDVCPTGALSARGTKWHGALDTQVSTVCGLCNINCGIVAGVKWGKLIETTPDHDSYTNGQLCVLGRFCIPGIVNHPLRIKYPQVRKDGWLIPVDWEEAFEAVAEGLKRYQPNEIGFVLSLDLGNEAAFMLLQLAAKLGVKNVALAGEPKTYAGGNVFGVSALCETAGFNDGKLMAPEGLAKQGELKAIYTTQDLAGAEDAEFLIVQDVFSSHSLNNASVVLPALSFMEVEGSVTSFDGNIRNMSPTAEPYARAMPDWEIARNILKAFGGKDYYALEEVRSAVDGELAKHKKPDVEEILSDRMWLPNFLKENKDPQYVYRGMDLTDIIDDLRVLKEGNDER